MSQNEDPKEIDRLPNPKWSKQKMELHPRKALFPWWVWPLVILAAVLTFVVVWFGFVQPSLKAKEIASYTPTPTVTPTPPPPTGLPPVPPTATIAIPTATPEAIPTPSGSIAVSGKVRVTGTGTAKLNLRENASTTAAILTRVSDGTEFTVLEGPTTADGYQWWKVTDGQGTTGWAAANYLQPIP